MKKPECDWISESIAIAVKAINSIYMQQCSAFQKKIAQNENKNFESETHFSKSTHRRSRRRHKSYQHIAVC